MERSKSKNTSWVASSFSGVSNGFDSANINSNGGSSKASTHKRKNCESLWIHEHSPLCRNDLAVHKKKILEVSAWFDKIENNESLRKNFLLISGPSGSGKSSTVKVIAKELGYNLRKWENLLLKKYDPDLECNSYCNQIQQFSEFLLKSGRYNSIVNISTTESNSKSIVLITEFPSPISSNPTEFHSILKRYSIISRTPIVFIVDDLSSKSLKELFPSDLLQDLAFTTINFNPISSTLMVGAMNRVLSLNAHENISTISNADLKSVAEASMGDIRSAISILQFIAAESGREIKDFNNLLPIRKKSKKGSRAKDQNDLSTTCKILGSKDSSLILFRALGKILYCKRDAILPEPTELPKHLLTKIRAPLLENPEAIFEQSSLDASSFSLFLHHNFLPFFDNIEAVEDVLQKFGDADIMNSFWNASDRLSTLSASICSRGIMFNKIPLSSANTFHPLTKPFYYTYLNKAKDWERDVRYNHITPIITMQESLREWKPLWDSIKKGELKNEILNQESDIKNSLGLLGRLPSGYQSVNKDDDDPEEDFLIEEFID